jgi:lipid A disaccharide synthetase
MSMMAPCSHQERWSAWCKLEMISATGFLAVFGCLPQAWQNRKKTARFPGDP